MIGNNNVAGLIGYAENLYISKSYVIGEIKSNDVAGGLVAWAENVNISNARKKK